MDNKFCFLKGLVDCSSGRIQDCNMKRVNCCPLDNPQGNAESRKSVKKEDRPQAFCFLKGLVDCAPCDVQDCNIKRVRKCPLDT